MSRKPCSHRSRCTTADSSTPAAPRPHEVSAAKSRIPQVRQAPAPGSARTPVDAVTYHTWTLAEPTWPGRRMEPSKTFTQRVGRWSVAEGDHHARSLVTKTVTRRAGGR